MARPRKPTAVLELTGAFKHDPKRNSARQNEPAPNGPIGDVPLHFDKKLTALWYELIATAPAGVLTRADRWTVEVACRMMRMVRDGMFGAAEVNVLMRCLARMGLTPADRSHVAVPKQAEAQDEFSALAAEGKVLRPN
jgi:hypothetical protein